MDEAGILTTAAEVAVAIGGFSGIVVVLGPRRGEEWPASSRLLLSALLLMAIAIVGFAFLPLLLRAAAVSERTLWPIASALHAVYLTCVVGYRIRQMHRFPKDQRHLPAQPLIGVTVLGVLVLQACNGLWLQAPWPYLAAIVLMVLGSFGVFAALLWQLWAAA
jgi:hypothetical protein